MKLKKLRNIFTVLVIAAAAVSVHATASLAERPDIHWNDNNGDGEKRPDEGKEHHKKHGRHQEKEIKISESDREILRRYMHGETNHHCPPGLAKKHNGCLPPGLAKKYAIGQALPDDAAVESLPDAILKTLARLPEGYRYGRSDNEILLLSDRDRKVIDAISLISEIGK